MMDAWKDVLNGRCFWQFSASCSILGTFGNRCERSRRLHVVVWMCG